MSLHVNRRKKVLLCCSLRSNAPFTFSTELLLKRVEAGAVLARNSSTIAKRSLSIGCSRTLLAFCLSSGFFETKRERFSMYPMQGMMPVSEVHVAILRNRTRLGTPRVATSWW